MAEEKELVIKNLFQIWGREKAIKIFAEATRELRKHITVEEQYELSPEAREIKEICMSYGPSGIKLARMFGIVMKQNIIIKDNNKMFPFIQFAGIVLKTCPNGEYETGIPLFMLIPDKKDTKMASAVKLMSKEGVLGQHLSVYEKNVEVMSDESVVKVLNKVFDRLLAEGIDDTGLDLS
jgi:hypothetical protein